MHDEDVHAKIARLAAEDKRGEEMMAKARADCHAALHSMQEAIMSIHNTVPQTHVLNPPVFGQGVTAYQRDSQLDDEHTWHYYNSEDGGAPRIWSPLDDYIITYNPLRDTWRYHSDGRGDADMTRPEILDHYTDLLARWVVDKYPVLLRKREDEEAQVAARRAAEARLYAATVAQDDVSSSRKMLLAIIAGLFVLYIFAAHLGP